MNFLLEKFREFLLKFNEKYLIIFFKNLIFNSLTLATKQMTRYKHFYLI